MRSKNDRAEAAAAIVEDRAKSKDDRYTIMVALSKHFLFTNLTDEDREIVVKAMRHYTVK